MVFVHKRMLYFISAARRMKKPGDRVDLESRSALILPDFCFVPHTKDFQHSTMSVEIKVIRKSHFIEVG